MSQPIQAIVMTYTTKHDSNGNVANFSVVWSAAAGRELNMAMDDCSSSNAMSILHKFFNNNYEATLALESTSLSKKEWAELKRIYGASYHNDAGIASCLAILFPNV